MSNLGIDPAEFEELQIRVKNNKKYERLSSIFVGYAILLLLILLGVNPLAKLALGRDPYLWETVILMAPIVTCWVLVAYIAIKGVRKYSVSQNEWAIYYCQCTLHELRKYHITKSLELKKEYIENAIGNVKGLISTIEKRWGIGSFYLVRNTYEKPLTDLKQNFREKVIPLLKESENASTMKIEAIMMDFLAKLRSLNLEGINFVNQEMSTLPSPKTAAVDNRSTLEDQIKDMSNAHRTMTNLFFIFSLVAGCIVFYWLVTSYVGIIKEYAFAGVSPFS
jgi:hypothetical protein